MNLQLSIGITNNPRTWPILDGTVKPDGIDLIPTVLHPSELFWRQLHFAEFAVSEMSCSSFMIATGQGDTRFVGLPIFTTRRFFHTTHPGQPQIRHREAGRSQGQARRRAGISADRGAMGARRAAARIRRAAEGHGILDGAHAGKKPRRRHRLQAAARRRRPPDAGRQEHRRDDARRRARCHGALSVRPQSGRSQPRRSRAPSRFQISVPRPGRRRHPLLPQDRDFPDQSPGRGAARCLRERALGGAEPAQGVQQANDIANAQRIEHVEYHLATGLLSRRRENAVAPSRRQSQPQGDRDHRAIFAGAGPHPAADQARRALRAERAGVTDLHPPPRSAGAD